MDRRTTYMSFWSVGLSNLSVGSFRKRRLSSLEARDLISSARTAGKLVCVSKDDLGAPYCDRERELHEQLCEALRDHVGIAIGLEDFFGSNCANPLCLAQVGDEEDLLVVDCHYVLNGEGGMGTRHPTASEAAERSSASMGRLGKSALRMKLVPDSITFYLFEKVRE